MISIRYIKPLSQSPNISRCGKKRMVLKTSAKEITKNILKKKEGTLGLLCQKSIYFLIY